MGKSRLIHIRWVLAARQTLALLAVALLLLLVVSCAPAAPPAPEVVKTVEVVQTVVVTKEVEGEVRVATATKAPAVEAPAPTATIRPAATSTPAVRPTQLEVTQVQASPAAAPTPVVEARQVELEWPATLRFGESDVVRLSLIPSQEGYVIQKDFPEHGVQTQELPVKRPPGSELSAVARLDGVGFEIAPTGDQERSVPEGERVDWRWTLTPRQTGRQRLAVVLLLRWRPLPGSQELERETAAYTKALDIRVTSFMGLTRNQAAAGGLLGLVFGGGLSLGVLVPRTRPPRTVLRSPKPNPELAIEPRPGLKLTEPELTLLRMLFERYARVGLESEFLSGYSGARTFLALPLRADGRADAYTIVKMGEREAIQREFENYEAFVKDTLPPVTARIQHTPVAQPVTPRRRRNPVDGRDGVDLAALQYTFIAEPGRVPSSLREVLCAAPDPSRLEKLFEVFGPNWWMQRRPYTFRLALEYDRMLPTHLVVEPCEGHGRALDGRMPPGELDLQEGEIVSLVHFPQFEYRPDGRSLSLRGVSSPGQPILRVRWLGVDEPNGATGRVVATRGSVLREWTAEFTLGGLPDPLLRLAELLNESVSGTQSVIHGDLNLENVLVGPGDFVWLIDFAQTREGHTLYDFAHLYAEIVAHVLAARLPSPADYLALLQDSGGSPYGEIYSLLATVDGIAGRCLFNPSQPREWRLAKFAACLGAIKFANLTPFARHLLYLTAANTAQSL